MNKELCGLILIGTIFIFAIIGYLVTFLFNKKQKKKIDNIILEVLFFTILAIIIIYIFPLIYNCLDFMNFYLFLIFLVVGFIIIKVIDNFLPYHDDNKLLKKELKNNYWHIGFLSIICFAVYNIMIGIDVYNITLNNVNSGINSTISAIVRVGLFSFLISYLINQESISVKKKILVSFCYFLSIICGGIIGFILNGNLNALIFGCFLSITFGMFTYILVNELWNRIRKTKDKKKIILEGIIIFIIFLVSAFI